AGSGAVRRLLPPCGGRRAARLRSGHAMTAAAGRSLAGFYPVFLNLRGRRAVVVGGGAVAEQKVLGLLDAGAHVTVVSGETTPRLEDLAARGAIEIRRRPYRSGDLAGAWLAIAATDDRARTKLWYRIVDSDVVEFVRRSDLPGARRRIEELVRDGRARGVVYLVGAGPGDPRLITVRGLEILRSAEVVVYDRLVHPA